jgi:hypothetical protein
MKDLNNKEINIGDKVCIRACFLNQSMLVKVLQTTSKILIGEVITSRYHKTGEIFTADKNYLDFIII